MNAEKQATNLAKKVNIILNKIDKIGYNYAYENGKIVIKKSFREQIKLDNEENI